MTLCFALLCENRKVAVLAADSRTIDQSGIVHEHTKISKGPNDSVVMVCGISAITRDVIRQVGSLSHNTTEPDLMILGTHQLRIKKIAASLQLHYRDNLEQLTLMRSSYVHDISSYLVIHVDVDRIKIHKVLGDTNLSIDSTTGEGSIGDQLLFDILLRLKVEKWNLDISVDECLTLAKEIMLNAARVSSFIGPPFRFYTYDLNGNLKEKTIGAD